jgi:hypothetical protein
MRVRAGVHQTTTDIGTPPFPQPGIDLTKVLLLIISYRKRVIERSGTYFHLLIHNRGSLHRVRLLPGGAFKEISMVSFKSMDHWMDDPFWY